MSRFYEMAVEVRVSRDLLQSDGDLPDGFEERLRQEWDFEEFNWDTIPDTDHKIVDISFSGQDYIAAGHDEMEVALNISKAVWFVMGQYCPVDVRATYLEDQPYEEYSFTQEKYEEVMT
jgi:hypothetical protein